MLSHLFYGSNKDPLTVAWMDVKFIYSLAGRIVSRECLRRSSDVFCRKELTINPLQCLDVPVFSTVKLSPKYHNRDNNERMKERRNNNHNTCNFITKPKRKKQTTYGRQLLKWLHSMEWELSGLKHNNKATHPLSHLRFSNSSNVFRLQLRDWAWKQKELFLGLNQECFL